MEQTEGPKQAKGIEEQGTRGRHSEEIREWKLRLAAFQAAKGEDGHKWLQVLYNSYLQQFLSDNNRIWATGEWMISLSLAPFVAIPTLKSPFLLAKLVALAIPSVVLVWVWLVIAENHRGFQEKSREWLFAIEELLGVDKPGGPKASGSLVKPGRVRTMRWVLAFGISILWALIFISIAIVIWIKVSCNLPLGSAVREMFKF